MKPRGAYPDLPEVEELRRGYRKDAPREYLADIVEQIKVQDGPRYVIHTNTILVRAESPDEAFTKAEEIGRSREISYENPSGKQVTIAYRGLRDLNVIFGELEHGTELAFAEDIETDESAVERYTTPREQLGVFCPIERSTGPNYGSLDVIDKLRELSPGLDLTDLERE